MKHTVFKKLLCACLTALVICCGAFGARGFSSEADGTVLPILMYHEVKPFGTRKDVITPRELESDLSYLKSAGYTALTMTDLIDCEKEGRALPPKPIVLSFDDGYLNNYVYVYPLLKKYDMKIVLSIIGKNTDDFTRIPDDNLDYAHVTWSQVVEMQRSGLVEIQNHTYAMHTITRKRFGCQKSKRETNAQYEAALTADVTRLQDEIIRETGVAPNTFTYPYGQVSKESVPILKKLGFQASLTCDYGVNLLKGDPEELYRLRRVCRAHGVPAQKALKDAMETLRFR